MARRTLLKPHDRQELVGIPTDEDSLIRHYSLSPADRLEIEVRRREHNRLGFALQLCLMGVGSGWGRNDTLSRCFLGPEIFAGQ